MYRLGLWTEKECNLSPHEVEAIERYFGMEGNGRTTVKVDSSVFDDNDENEKGDQTRDGNSQDADDEDEDAFRDLYA
jgi:hypothetical protein